MKSSNIFQIATVAFLLITTNVHAQNSVGLRGGFSMFTVKNFPVESNGQIVTDGVGFGNYNAISFEIGLGTHFAIQPEFNFIQKAGKINFEETDGLSLKVKMDYIETPILAKLRLGTGRFRGYLMAGPSVGYALNGKTTLTSDEIRVEDKIKFDDSYVGDGRKDNRFDLGIVGGGGVQYQLGPGSIVLDARVALDLNDYNKYENGRPGGTDATRWEGLMVSLGYQYEFGGK